MILHQQANLMCSLMLRGDSEIAHSKSKSDVTLLMYNQASLLIFISLSTMIIGCDDRAELTPSELIPFEYSATLNILSSSCLDSDHNLDQRELTGTFAIGERDGMVIAEIKAEQLEWNFSGLICLDDTPNQTQPIALCLGLRSSSVFMSLPSTNQERFLCEHWTSSPSVSPLVSPQTSAQLLPSDPDWRAQLEFCCLNGEANDFAVRIELNDLKKIGGEFSVRHELIVRPQGTAPLDLSESELLGAIALCGPPRPDVSVLSSSSCTERFAFRADAR